MIGLYADIVMLESKGGVGGRPASTAPGSGPAGNPLQPAFGLG